MQAWISARRAPQRTTHAAMMIRWMVAIALAGLLAIVAAADLQQNGPSANGPITLNGANAAPAQSKSESSEKSDGYGQAQSPSAQAEIPEPFMIVPPASIKAPIGPVNGVRASTASSTTESRGLGSSANSKSNVVATDHLKNQAATATTSTSSILGSEFGRVVAALAVIIGLILLVRVFTKRAGGFMPGGDRPSGVVEILARFPVARGQQLILLKLARRIMLLHQTGSAMTALSEMTDPDEVASLLARLEAGSSGRSAERFQRVLQSFESEHDSVPEIHTVRNPPRLTRGASDGNEVIDLTRSRLHTLAGLLMGKAAR